MGFFKDFKDDVSQAMNELVDDATGMGTGTKKENINDNTMVDTLGRSTQTADTKTTVKPAAATTATTTATTASAPSAPRVHEPAPVSRQPEQTKQETPTPPPIPQPLQTPPMEETVETAIITPGLKITGDIESSGAIELLGTVIGNVSCLGKLSVSGTIKGNTHSAAFYSNEADITGNISCDGAAKLGNGSVVIGDLAANSAVIAGAIKGDIDVHGPVIIDTTAIVMGDIKSVSVQINNGAVIEGHCSQCYSDNSPSKFFKDR